MLTAIALALCLLALVVMCATWPKDDPSERRP